MELSFTTDKNRVIENPERDMIREFATKGLMPNAEYKIKFTRVTGTRQDKTNAYFKIMCKSYSDYTGYTIREATARIFKYCDAGITHEIRTKSGEIMTDFIRESTARDYGMTEGRLLEIIKLAKQMFIQYEIPLPIAPKDLIRFL